MQQCTNRWCIAAFVGPLLAPPVKGGGVWNQLLDVKYTAHILPHEQKPTAQLVVATQKKYHQVIIWYKVFYTQQKVKPGKTNTFSRPSILTQIRGFYSGAITLCGWAGGEAVGGGAWETVSRRKRAVQRGEAPAGVEQVGLLGDFPE